MRAISISSPNPVVTDNHTGLTTHCIGLTRDYLAWPLISDIYEHKAALRLAYFTIGARPAPPAFAFVTSSCDVVALAAVPARQQRTAPDTAREWAFGSDYDLQIRTGAIFEEFRAGSVTGTDVKSWPRSVCARAYRLQPIACYLRGHAMHTR